MKEALHIISGTVVALGIIFIFTMVGCVANGLINFRLYGDEEPEPDPGSITINGNWIIAFIVSAAFINRLTR